MKAKKLIAVGLAAAMTVGMTISAFATVPFDYYDVPQLEDEDWESDHDMDENIFHESGKGWLESGKGINESATNVMVPTMPAVNIRYGQPGLFDFGFDPQRLVDRTEELKYQDKENFTPSALKNGVYFMNGRLAGYELNTYDNKSVKLKGTNLGTEPVGFKVTATLKNGEGIKYLDKVPVNVNTAAKDFDDMWGTYGTTWYEFVTTHGLNPETPYYSATALTNTNRSKLQFAIDLGKIFSLENDLPYRFIYLGNDPDTGVYSEADFETLMETYNKRYLKDGAVQSTETMEMLQTVTALQAVTNDAEFLAALEDYKGTDVVDGYELSDSTDIGMYLGLNTALGTTAFNDEAYEGEGAVKVETPIVKETDSATTATATGEVRVEGTRDNYTTTYSKEQRKYIFTMKENGELEPFKTVAFWFRGVATANESVPETLEVPELVFTWSFSKEDVPEVPVVAPKLTAINGNDVPGDFNGEFTSEMAAANDGKIVLTFDHVVDTVVYSRTSADAILWDEFADANYCEYAGNQVTVYYDYWIGRADGDRYVRVYFTEGYSEDNPQYLGSYTFVKSQNLGD